MLGKQLHITVVITILICVLFLNSKFRKNPIGREIRDGAAAGKIIPCQIDYERDMTTIFIFSCITIYKNIPLW